MPTRADHVWRHRPASRISSSSDSARSHLPLFPHAEMAALKLITFGATPASLSIVCGDCVCVAVMAVYTVKYSPPPATFGEVPLPPTIECNGSNHIYVDV